MKRKTDNLGNKGFTLVELIVVMVILTLLAAILVSSLLGWIDEAKGKQYILSARSIYMSAQAIESEKYAAWDGTSANANHNLSDSDKARIMRMADVEGAEIISVQFLHRHSRRSPLAVSGGRWMSFWRFRIRPFFWIR